MLYEVITVFKMETVRGGIGQELVVSLSCWSIKIPYFVFFRILSGCSAGGLGNPVLL